MGAPKYDEAIIKSPEGDQLYKKWLRVHKRPCAPEFKDFMEFYNWAMEAGYKLDSVLLKKEASLPYTPDNCMFTPALPQGLHWDAETRRAIERWDRFVNRVRKANGMEPLKSTEEAEEEKNV